MELEVSKEMKCPYCGCMNSVKVQVKQIGINHHFVLCDVDMFGCGEKILIESKVTVISQLSAAMIPKMHI